MPVVYTSVLTALYDYTPDGADDEVAIKEDQILLLLDGSGDEWWKIKIKTNSQEDNGSSGLVPKAYVEEAKPITHAKALYDYTANGDGELSITEDEPLLVYEQEEEWSLVKSSKPGGKAGYVPATYIELAGAVQDEQEEEDAVAAASISTPAAAPRSSYSDPTELVAASHTKARDDPVQTWSVSILDKKDKKKKGTLGVGNGSIFFASEADKTPVQQWQTSAVVTVTSEKAKHVDVQIATGSDVTTLRFVASSKDVAEEIIAKVHSSKTITSASSTPAASLTPNPINTEAARAHKNGASVRFAMSPDSVIPNGDEEEEEGEEGEQAVALYDFNAQAADELTVKEGETVVVTNRVESEEWWKCRNAKGEEGVVPSSYLEVKTTGSDRRTSQDDEDTAVEMAAAKAAEQQAAAVAEQKRLEQVKQREEAERLAAEEKRRKREQERAEAEARRRELEKLENERSTKSEASRSSPGSRPSTESEPRRSTADKPRPSKTRVWHDRTGQFKVEAEFLGFENGKIKLHKTNGVIIDVPSAKMSPEDMAYVNKLIGSGKRPATTPDEDNVPLSVIAERRSSRPPSQPPRPTPQSQPKKPRIDWFEFFLNAGCDMDDCTRYAASFNRDKIDEEIVGEIKDSTLRSLGLREGDIIRVMKAIEKRGWRREDDSARKEQMRKDEEFARQLQAQENAASPRRSNTTSPAPNLFAAPGGALKNQTRRGRPPPSSSTAPIAVDVNALQTSSRGSTPQITSPASNLLTTSPTERPASASTTATPAPTTAPLASGFDDDAWTPRPSSAKPTSPAPAVALSPPPAPTPPVAPTPPPAPPAPTTVSVAAPAPSIASGQTLQRPATTTPATTSNPASSDFDILAKIGQMKLEQQQRPPSAPIISQPTGMGLQAPASFQSGLGMGNSPVPVGQLLTAQQTGVFSNLGPRGPPAPVPANQNLLSPLISTKSGFNSFVPTRPGSTPTFGGGLQPQPTGFQPAQPSFLQSQPTGFQQSQPSFLSSQPTGFQPSQPSFLQSQPTGFQPSQPSFLQPQQTGFTPSFTPSQSPLVGPQPNGMSGMFGAGIQPQATGFQPSFQPQQQNLFNTPPSNAPPQNNLSAANVFASMKAGTFAGADHTAPQSADKYDALRQPNGPNFMQPQQTGFGFQAQQQFRPGFGGY